MTSSGSRGRPPGRIAVASAIGICLIGAAYLALPAAWKHYEHRKGLEGRPMVTFTKQGIPRWVTNDGVTQKAYDEYVDKVCPCVILVHSQGGNFGITAALNNPSKVKALVLVEPSGAPDPDKTDISALRNIPILWVWGDYLDTQPFWKNIYAKQEQFRAAVNRIGGKTESIVLPSAGIKGNSHMMMMDRNSDQIAALIQDFLVSRGLSTK